MNLEKNINNINNNETLDKKEEQEQEISNLENKESQGKENPSFESLKNYDAENLNEETVKDINRKIETGEMIADSSLMEKSALAGDQITQEIIQKHLEDTEKYDGKKGVFMKLKQNKVFKVASKAILAYMLFFKGYDAFAGNETEKDEVNKFDKMEMTDENLGSNNNTENDKTYNINESDFEDKEGDKENNKGKERDNNEKENFDIEKTSVLEIDQNYEHNSAEIDQEGKDKIINHTISFFEDMLNENGEIDTEKLRDFLSTDVKIKASANELQRIGGNAELAEARGEALKQVIDNNIENITQNLKDLGLEQDNIDKIIDKLNQAEIEIPESENGERGVTYITDMENPETGENYTDAEVENLKENNPDKYQKLLAEARSVKIDLSATSEEDINKMESKKLNLEADNVENLEERDSNFKPDLKKMAEYQEIIVANDNSGSTQDDNISMVNRIHKNFNDIVKSSKDTKIEEIKVASFSNDSDKVKTYDKDNADKAFERLYSQEAKGDSYERAVDAALNILDEADAEKNSLLYINTDESIQATSLNDMEKLKNKAQEKNVDIKFLLKPIEAIDKEGNKMDLEEKYVEIDINEVYNNILESYKAGVEKTFNSYKNYYGDSYSDDQITKMLADKIESGKTINKDLKTIKLENGTKLKFHEER
jgi:hypothetical protein